MVSYNYYYFLQEGDSTAVEIQDVNDINLTSKQKQTYFQTTLVRSTV